MNRRFSLMGIVHALMLAENMGDVHEEINHLHDLIGLSHPEGSFLAGWTEQDLSKLESSDNGTTDH